MTTSARDFYERRVPGHWNRALEEQQRAGDRDASAARVAAAMQAVNGTIRVRVRSADASEESHNLNISAGRMSASDEPTHPPFMTLVHDLAAFEVLERESGDSVLGFLGGLAGLGDEMKLTAQKMQNLAELEGTLQLQLTGEGGFGLLVHFGVGPIASKPDCSLEVEVEAYEQLRSGQLSPQDAFMNGQIVAKGDMQMAMQLALAAMTPD